MDWDPSDIEMSNEPLEDYDFGEDVDDLEMPFLGAWSPDENVPDDLLSLEDAKKFGFEAKESFGTLALTTPTHLYPNGASWAEVGVQLTRGGAPAPNIPVDFSVEAVRPTNGWRNVNEVAGRMRGNAAEFRRRVGSGAIKLLGTMSPGRVNTDSNGIAKSRYIVSNIGGNQGSMALERISMSSQAGVTRHDINIGYDFVDVPTVSGGLRIVGATGRHCQNGLSGFVQNLVD